MGMSLITQNSGDAIIMTSFVNIFRWCNGSEMSKMSSLQKDLLKKNLPPLPPGSFLQPKR